MSVEDSDMASHICRAEVREHGRVQAISAGQSFTHDLGPAGGPAAVLDGFNRGAERYALGGPAEVYRRR